MTIRAWKDAEYRASLTPEQLLMVAPSPVGEALTEEELAQQVGGGGGKNGWLYTWSGECNASGACCNPFGSNAK